jgi:VIT1/CCC1 family predicted Fe2+/Mn2+ transporter
MGIFCVLLMTTTIGTNAFEWSYVLDTPLNWVVIWAIILGGLVLAILGVKKAKITKWVTIPVFIPYVLWAVVAVIQGYWLIFGAI